MEFTRPIRVMKNIKTGSSKMTPNARRSLHEKERNSLIESIGFMDSVEKLTKNLNPIGKTVKYANREPPTKQIVEKKTKGKAYFFSEE